MWFVYRKELLELIRDKKTLFFVVFLPLLIFPLLIFVIGGIVANVTLSQHQQVLNYHVVNASAAPKFTEMIKYHRDFTMIEPSIFKQLEADASKSEIVNEIATAVQAGLVDIVIVINEDYIPEKVELKQDTWTVYYNNAQQMNSVRSKFNKVLQKYKQSIRLEYLTVIGINEQAYEVLSNPINLKVVDTASQRESIGEQVGGILPYLLIMLCLTGAMYPAIDIGAGEKERNTLESLLLSSVSLHLIILGKFFTIMTTGIITALMSVISIGLWTSVASLFVNINVIHELSSLFSFTDLVLIILMVLPVAAIFAAILLSISIYARSFKEAQNYMGLVTMGAFFPVMLAMLPGINLTWAWACVPITNVALAIKELIKGTVDSYMVITIFFSTLIFALIAISFCVHWFKKESVLFR